VYRRYGDAGDVDGSGGEMAANPTLPARHHTLESGSGVEDGTRPGFEPATEWRGRGEVYALVDDHDVVGCGERVPCEARLTEEGGANGFAVAGDRGGSVCASGWVDTLVLDTKGAGVFAEVGKEVQVVEPVIMFSSPTGRVVSTYRAAPVVRSTANARTT
jgi:hypothetical protein